MASTARTFVVTLALALAATLAPPGHALADELLIENVTSAQATAAERPARGSSMTRVESRFGVPTSRSGPVGQPPITRWEYPGFVVFFEYDHVVHAVGR
jgi:hypothetical protein